MKIVSNFKDSYDSLQDYQSDIIWNRFSHIEELKNFNYGSSSLNYYFTNCSFECFYLGFCGKVYMAAHEENSKTINYTVESVQKLIGNTNLGFGQESSKRYLKKHIGLIANSDYFKEFFAFSPIFMISKFPNDGFGNQKTVIQYNVKLQDFDFYKVLSVYNTYQELDNWMTNQAIPMKQIPEPTNKEKIQLAGFDLKTSFRKGK